MDEYNIDDTRTDINNVNDAITKINNIMTKINNNKYNLIFDLVTTMFKPFSTKKFKYLTQIYKISEDDLIKHKNHCDTVIILFYDRLIINSLIDENDNVNIKTSTFLNKILKKINMRLKSTSICNKKYYSII
jgi:hypothetical protein